MSLPSIRRHNLQFEPDSSRVLIRPFIPAEPHRIVAVIGRALSLSDQETEEELQLVMQEFSERHTDMEKLLLTHFERVRRHISLDRPLSRSRRLFIGALFTGEYALESAALFNPSIVPHPDQTGLPEGALRFIVSLRATGEGHISSIEFRAGVIDAECNISIDPVSRHVTAPDLVRNPKFFKEAFVWKLREVGLESEFTDNLLGHLEEEFTFQDLERAVRSVDKAGRRLTLDEQRTIEVMKWLAESNYQIQFDSKLALSERIIFPFSANESNGIEDARFVRFQHDDGTICYHATYTAYNGRAILPQLISTEDFLHFRVVTLNGRAVQNKGMALFPRTVNGKYVMISRQDDENIFIMYTENPHFWNEPEKLLHPAEPWEFAKIGNCGSPIETEQGWLLITHGVGPMRKYCIGAILLDLENPSRVLKRLRKPLLKPEGNEREGYVPNVVYTCGALLHGDQLVLPYAMSDKASTIATLDVNELLAAMEPVEPR